MKYFATVEIAVFKACEDVKIEESIVLGEIDLMFWMIY